MSKAFHGRILIITTKNEFLSFSYRYRKRFKYQILAHMFFFIFIKNRYEMENINRPLLAYASLNLSSQWFQSKKNKFKMRKVYSYWIDNRHMLRIAHEALCFLHDDRYKCTFSLKLCSWQGFT